MQKENLKQNVNVGVGVLDDPHFKEMAKTNKGITLIALIITIIVMLILVGVSVTVALNGGLFRTAEKATTDTEIATEREQLLSIILGAINNKGKVDLNKLDELILADKTFEKAGEGTDTTRTYKNKKSGNIYTVGQDLSITLGNASSDEGTGGNTGDDTEDDIIDVEPISIDTDCVGYYADIDKEVAGPEGVIYIEIANTQSGWWDSGLNSYTITNVTDGLKEYYVSSEEDYEGVFGTKPVLSLVEGSTGTIDRFHVMALEDVNHGTRYCWYDAAYDNGISDYATLTGRGIRNEEGVSIGKINTENMLAAWNENPPTYGTQNDNEIYDDIWGVIEAGWYVPSIEEWYAFASSLAITSDNMDSKGVHGGQWSSTLYSPRGAYSPYFFYGGMFVDERDWDLFRSAPVRLGTTF